MIRRLLRALAGVVHHIRAGIRRRRRERYALTAITAEAKLHDWQICGNPPGGQQ